jgi:hypothetical protein
MELLAAVGVCDGLRAYTAPGLWEVIHSEGRNGFVGGENLNSSFPYCLDELLWCLFVDDVLVL